MVSTFISLLDIQSWWEIPCIAHFCSLFSSAFNLPDIDIEDLESALLTDGTDESVGLIPELIVHLLKGCDKLRKLRKQITISNYQMFLRRFLRHQCRFYNIENYFDTDIDFESLAIRNKLLILHSLCHFRLDSSDVQDILSNLEADSLRVEPLGYDSKNSGYWYFYGTRLYREDIIKSKSSSSTATTTSATSTAISSSSPSSSSSVFLLNNNNGKNQQQYHHSLHENKQTIWQVICFTEEDWQNLATKFKNSKNSKERALYQILFENFLPKLPQLFREREKLRRKKLFQVRNSARIRNYVEEKQKEIDEKETAELAEKQQIEIEQATSHANKYKSSRIRRRSQSSSTASGISTYASSFCGIEFSSDSTEFLIQREKFCLSTEEEDEEERDHEDKEIFNNRSSTSNHQFSFFQHTNSQKYIDYKIKNNDNYEEELLNEEICSTITTTKEKLLKTSPISKTIKKITRTKKTITKKNTKKRISKKLSSQQKTNLTVINSNNYDDVDENIDELNKEKYKGENKENYHIIESDSSESYCSSIKSLASSSSAKKSSISKSIEDMAPTANIKLPGRQTNNSLSSISDNIYIPSSVFGNNSSTPSSSSTTTTTTTTSVQQQGNTTESSMPQTNSNSNSSNSKNKDKMTPTTTTTNTTTSSSSNITDHPPQKKKKSKSSGIFTESDEVLQIGMHKVLVSVKNHKDAWPFTDPVDEEFAPEYYTIIRRPMDINKMEEKLDNGEYKKFSDFRNDFKLIVNNCRLYNGQGNEYTAMVNELEIEFDKATKKYFEDNSSDDDLCYPDLKTTVFREKNSNNTKINSMVKGTKSSLSPSSSPSTSSVVASTSTTITTKVLKDSAVKVTEDKGNSNSKSKGKGSNKLQNEKSIENNDINSAGSSKHEKQKSKNNNSKGTKRKRKDRDKKKRKKIKLDVTAAESETDDENNDSDHEEENENDVEDVNNDNHHQHRNHQKKNSGQQQQQKQRKKSNKNVQNSDNERENNDDNVSNDNGKEEEKEQISKGKKQKQKHNNKEQEISSDTVKSRKSSSKSNTLSDKIADVKTPKRNKKNQAQSSTTPPSKSKSSSNSKKVEEGREEEEKEQEDKIAVSGNTKSSRNKRESNKKTKNNNKIEKKPCTSSASSKKDSKDVLSDDDNDNNHVNNDSDIESILDNEDLPKEVQKSKKEKQTTSKNTKKPSSSSSTRSKNSSTNNVNSSTSSTSNKKTKQEKENQNTKSKSNNKKNSLPSSPSNTEDNNNKLSRTRNSTSTNSKNKKNKSSIKKNDIPQPLKKQKKQQNHDSTDNEDEFRNKNDIENNDNDDNSIDSRSSSPLYKVDLHKKYAQSASMDFNDELLYSEPPPPSPPPPPPPSPPPPPPPSESNKNHRHNKKSRYNNSTTTAKTTTSPKTNNNNNRKSNHDDNNVMIISVSNQSLLISPLSRSPSPSSSSPSSTQPAKSTTSTTNCEKKDKKRKATTSNKKNEKRKKCETITTDVQLPSEPSSSPSNTKTSSEPSTSTNIDNQKEILSPFLDKYDLIKQRRNRSTTASSTVPLTDEKWNQIVKDTKKNPKGIDGKNGTTQAGKNHYLNKTVEKLKAALTDPVFPVKPPATNEIKSEETVLQKPENTVSNDENLSIVDNSSVVEPTPGTSGTNKKSPSTKIKRNHRQCKESSTVTKKATPSNKRKTKNQKENKRSKLSNRKKKSLVENSEQNTEEIVIDGQGKRKVKKDFSTVAINVAAQQTLKDINRWLEFPSHLLDDLYAFALKADPNDFQKKHNFPIPDGLVNDLSTVVIANINSNDDNSSCISNSTKRDDIISNLISAASIINAANNENIPILSNTSMDSHQTPTTSLLSFASSSASTTVTTTASTLSTTTTTTTKTTASTTQFLAHPPPPPHVKTQQQKEAKRKSLKEKLQAAVSTGHHKRKDSLRTIDRLQPGKSKGNLLSNNNNRPDETRPLAGVSAKIKEVKNSLLVKTDETGPKLSLGSVLNTPESFGLGGQLHSFETDSGSSSSLRISEVIAGSSGSNSNGTGNIEKLTTIENKDDGGGSSSIDNKNSSENITEGLSLNANEISNTVKDGNNSIGNCVTSPCESKQEKSSATPNLSAWFKAFGGPKKAKTLEEEKKKNENLSSALDSGIEQQNQNGDNSDCNNLDEINAEVTTTMTSMSATMSSPLNTFNTLTSPPTSSNSNEIESFSLPAPRTRKASTGSTISERSSFSQDPDSPRVAIEDRFNTFAGTYPSPIGASPIMVSPKPDEITKPTSPYPLNGAIKVGFYQDTTTKSSPEKSCSPRELTSPAYPQYSQHVYSSASSPTVGNDVSTASATYGSSCYNTPSSVNGIGDVSNTTTSATSSAAATYPVASPVTLYEQYKQPHSHESDYNSSMSPMSTNPNSPYQQSSQNSPYHHQNSPYQQSQNSPYHQSQNSPFQAQAVTPAPQVMPPNKSPVTPTTNQQQSPQHGSLSPYQQSINSPYNQQPNSSPYSQQQHQHSASSPYHNQSQSQSVQIQQQQVNMNFNQTTLEQQQQQPIDSPQQPPSDSPFSSTESPQYQIHDSPQFQQPSDQQSVFDSEMSKDSTTATVPKNLSATNSMAQNSTDWSSEGTTLTELSPMVSPQQQPIRVHPQQQQDNNTNLHQYQGYPQYPMINKNNNPSGVVQHQQQQDLNEGDIVSGIKGMLTPQSNESDVLNLDSFTPESQPSTFTPESQPSGFTSESQPSSNKQKCGTDSGKSFDSTLNKHQQMFDSFLGSMGGGTGKNALGFGRPPLDISTSKAYEMFNRAATYGLSKEFQQNNLLSGVSGGKNMENIQSQQSVPQQQITKLQNTNNTGGKSILNSNYNQDQMIHHHQQQHQHQQQQQQPLENTSKLQQSLLGNQTNPYVNTNPNDMVSVTPNLPTSRQEQQQLQHMSDMSRTPTLNMDYKQTYNNPAAAMIDPLRNLGHPVPIMDENNMLNLQNVPSTGVYYDKNIPPAAHVFNKNLTTQQSYHPHHQNTSPYDARDPQNPAVANYISSANNPNNLITQQQQMTDVIEPLVTKPAKRGRKRKNPTSTTAVDTTAALNNQARNSMMPVAMSGQQLPQIQSQTLPTNVSASVVPNTAVSSQNIHDQQQQQQQGFQLYAGLKTASTSATTDSSAISLKSATATSMVPGSAFNFGPTGIGLPPAGIYGDQTAAAAGYLDEFRGAHNPYYPIPTGHRPPEMNNDKTTNPPPPPPPSAGPTPSTYHQFLTHPSSRTSYPFMNSPQIDPNSPIYQQYLQRQEELRARMMLNQGLLGPGPATAYPQSGYRAPIGMPKHYDMTRQPWY